jgi:Bacterial regulatory proteins, luxR family
MRPIPIDFSSRWVPYSAESPSVQPRQAELSSEIAERLILGETTIKTHITRILMKLGVRDRVQAVVLAYETWFITPGAT